MLDLEIDYDNPEGIVPTPVSGCTIRNVTGNWIHTSFFRGVPDAWLDGFTITGITVKVEPPKSTLDYCPYLFTIDEDQPFVNLSTKQDLVLAGPAWCER